MAAIAARVLQMGNSAYYSGGNVCFTVGEAVNRIGYNQIYELVSYAVASQVLVRPLAAYALRYAREGLESRLLTKKPLFLTQFVTARCGLNSPRPRRLS